jgi:hypothetical protein
MRATFCCAHRACAARSPHSRAILRRAVCFAIISASHSAFAQEWTSPNSGLWTDPTNWSPQQSPLTSGNAVIDLPGDYTIALDTFAAPSSLAMNAPGATLLVASSTHSAGISSTTGITATAGTIVLRDDGFSTSFTASLNNSSAVRVDPGSGSGHSPLINVTANSGTLVTINSSAKGALQVAGGEATIAAGAVFNMTGGISVSRGSLIINGTVGPTSPPFNTGIDITGGSVSGTGSVTTGGLNLGSNSIAMKFFVGGDVTLSNPSSSIPAGTTVQFLGGGFHSFSANTSSITNAGTIVFHSDDDFAYWEFPSGGLVNTGTIRAEGTTLPGIDNRGQYIGAAENPLFPVMNTATGVMDIAATTYSTVNNAGAIHVESSGIFTSGQFNMQAGALNVDGVMSVNAVVNESVGVAPFFNYTGGTINGTVNLIDTTGRHGTTANFGPGANSGNFVFSSLSSFTGDIHSGMTVSVATASTVTANSAATNSGTLTVSGRLTAPLGITNAGAINVSHGALAGPLTNTVTGIIAVDHSTIGSTAAGQTGAFINNGTTTVTTSARFLQPVTNNATFQATTATITFAGGFTNNGTYLSDPSTSIFTDLTIGPSGSITAGAGDLFIVSGSFTNNSTVPQNWDGDNAELFFSALAGFANTSPFHDYSLTDSAASIFWGTLGIGDGQIVSFHADAPITLDIGTLALNAPGITDITGDGSVTLNYQDLRIYSDPITFTDFGSGQLLAIPEPAAASILLALLPLIPRRRAKPR